MGDDGGRAVSPDLHPAPEYWGIELIGCQGGIGLPMEAPFMVTLDISRHRGKKGIEVMGATRSEKRDVP